MTITEISKDSVNLTLSKSELVQLGFAIRDGELLSTMGNETWAEKLYKIILRMSFIR